MPTEDLKNLIVSVNTTVEAYESTEGVIPCRPTINGVSIDLVDQHGYMVKVFAVQLRYNSLIKRVILRDKTKATKPNASSVFNSTRVTFNYLFD